MLKIARSYLHSSLQNTGMWRTDGQMDRIPLANTAVCIASNADEPSKVLLPRMGSLLRAFIYEASFSKGSRNANWSFLIWNGFFSERKSATNCLCEDFQWQSSTCKAFTGLGLSKRAQWLVGAVLFHLKFYAKVTPPPFKSGDFQLIFARSCSAVTPS